MSKVNRCRLYQSIFFEDRFPRKAVMNIPANELVAASMICFKWWYWSVFFEAVARISFKVLHGCLQWCHEFIEKLISMFNNSLYQILRQCQIPMQTWQWPIAECEKLTYGWVASYPESYVRDSRTSLGHRHCISGTLWKPKLIVLTSLQDNGCHLKILPFGLLRLHSLK